MHERLSSKEVSILEYLSSFGGQLDSFGRTTTREGLAMKFSTNLEGIDYHISCLIENSLIEKNESISDNIIYYSITPQGKKFLELLETDKKEKLIWSILVPIGVAVITTLIVNFLT